MADRSHASLLVQILAALSLAPACHPTAPSSNETTSALDASTPKAQTADTCPEALGVDVDWGGERPSMYDGVTSVCLPLGPGGSCSKYTDACILERYQCGKSPMGTKVLGKLKSTSSPACCWKVQGTCVVGRPFVVEGTARVAELRDGTDWRASLDLGGLASALDAATRAEIAAVWSADGLAEHAWVASFAQFVLELLAHGAPVDLVAGAQRALGEEIGHAERAFALAAAYGADVEPGPLPVAGALGAVFARAADHVGFGPCPAGGNDDVLRQHGVLPKQDRHDLAVVALRDVIAPAARALLETTGAPRMRGCGQTPVWPALAS